MSADTGKRRRDGTFWGRIRARLLALWNDPLLVAPLVPLAICSLIVASTLIQVFSFGLTYSDMSVIPRPTHPTTSIDFARELQARILWALTSTAFLVIAMCVSILALRQIFVSTKGQRALQRTSFLVVFGIWIIASVALYFGDPAVCSPDSSIQAQLLQHIPPRADSSNSAAPAITLRLDPTIANLLSILPIVALVTLMSLQTWIPSMQPDDAIDDLTARTTRLRFALYCGAALLVSGTLKIFASYNWVAATTPDEGTSATHAIAGTFAAATGGLYSMILFGAYVPAVLAVRAHALRLALATKKARTRKELRKFLEDEGLAEELGGRIWTVIALMSPLLSGLLAGPLADFLKEIGSS